MIAPLAVAAALMLPSREALLQRWLHANRAHATIALDRPRGNPGLLPNLQSLAQNELAVPGRYQLVLPKAPVEQEPWWLRAINWLSDRWQELWHKLFGRAHIAKGTAVAIGDWLLVLVGVALLALGLSFLRDLQLARERLRAAASPIEPPADPDSLYLRAREAAARGDYSGAARILFAATVAALAGNGTIDGRRSATVGELRRELRSANARLIVPFDAVAMPFVAAAYAERAVDAAQWQRASDAFDSLLAEGARP